MNHKDIDYSWFIFRLRFHVSSHPSSVKNKSALSCIQDRADFFLTVKLDCVSDVCVCVCVFMVLEVME